MPEHDVKVDVFVFTAERWGLGYLVRTGSADFSQAVLARWKRFTGGGYSKELQLHWPNGQVHATPEEEDVFKACSLRYVVPKGRETRADVDGAVVS